MDDIIKQTRAYLQTSTGGDVTISQLSASLKKQLPILITEAYKLYVCPLMGVDICLMFTKEMGTPIRLKKHSDIVQQTLFMHTAVVLSEVKPYQLQRMLAARINFIVPGRQLFLPSLLIDLRQPRNKINMEGQTMPVMAQCMILYHLQKQSLNGLSAQPIAELMGVSYPNISRAVKWLNENHIITLSQCRKKQLTFVKEGQELWQLALPRLQNPIERVLYTDNQLDALTAGEEALAEVSMLAEPNFHCWAISKEQARAMSAIISKDFGEHQVEIWRYDPRILVKEEGQVDRLSLYLTLKDAEDERVHKELDKLMKNQSWSKV